MLSIYSLKFPVDAEARAVKTGGFRRRRARDPIAVLET
jgi:hypothetical protein